MRLVHSLYSDVGMRRVENEDVGMVAETLDRHIFVVCDGMGGHRSGADAAKRAANEFVEAIRGGQSAITAGHAADAAVLSIEGKVSDRSPGATLTALIITDAGAQIAHVGDSEAFRLTAAGEFEKLTTDHGGMFGLDNFCGLGQNLGGFRVDVIGRPLQVGDRYLLATDGLTKHVKASELPDIMRRVMIKDLAAYLVELANERGGCDNTTVIAVEVREWPRMSR